MRRCGAFASIRHIERGCRESFPAGRSSASRLRARSLGARAPALRRAAFSLDVSVQAAICRLLLDLQRDYGTSYVFVSHDLAIVRYMSDRIVVMYLGEVVEEGDAESFDRQPLHPYTRRCSRRRPFRIPRRRLREYD
jgi:peptide/nickel transport system ATP-binding protein